MKIPKIIHQIWLDKPSMTQFFIKLTDTWKKQNPEWEHKSNDVFYYGKVVL